MHRYFILISALFIVNSGIVHAQEGNVEVDFGVLERLRNYNPPPMFERTFPPPIPNTENQGGVLLPMGLPEPVSNIYEEVSGIENNVPLPSRKPAYQNMRTALSSDSVISNVPIPKPRPNIIRASSDFISEARTQLNKEQIKQGPSPVLPSQLAEPSVEEVLSAITSNNKKPQAKSEMTTGQAKLMSQKKSNKVSIPFPRGKTTLPPGFAPDFINRIQDKLKTESGVVVRLKGYASAYEHVNPRNLSLARVLIVRDFLIEKGIASENMKVQAMGHEDRTDQPDRVDIFF